MNSSRSLAVAAAFVALTLAACDRSAGDAPNTTTPPGVAIVVTPAQSQVRPGAGLALAATVSGVADPGVTWSVVEEGGGTVDVGGVYTAPASTGSFHVVATSVADPTVSGTAEVIVAEDGSGVPPGPGGDPDPTGIIPGNRTTTWKPGIPGGVPTRTTVCATISAATYGNGTTDATAAIQSAINACPANQVVSLPAGTYRLSNVIVLNRPVVLRGAGANSTTLQPFYGG
ncbi:MAG TPA: glycosyl hydrolase family 28-related protein, partial [Anaeromyxobacter sp.]